MHSPSLFDYSCSVPHGGLLLGAKNALAQEFGRLSRSVYMNVTVLASLLIFYC